MDPFTVTGLALGIAPLIISAVENYEHTFQPFVTYCRYSREIDNFTTRLGAQKAIFNNQCQLLLSGANGDIDHEDATLERILSDPNHTSRRSERLNSRLEALLGNSLSACESTLRLTQRTLKDIMHDTKSFQKVLQQKGKGKGIFSHFRPRMKITFAKTRLNDTINELRQYNDDLRNLSSQVFKVNSHRVTGQSTRVSYISEFQSTQTISRELHGLLQDRWACQEDVRHVASLSLEPIMITSSMLPVIGFSLSLACVIKGNALLSDAIWVDVESTTTTRDILPALHSSAAQDTAGKPTCWQPLTSLSEAINEIHAFESERFKSGAGATMNGSTVTLKRTEVARDSLLSRRALLSRKAKPAAGTGGEALMESESRSNSTAPQMRAVPKDTSPATSCSSPELAPEIDHLCLFFRSQIGRSPTITTVFHTLEGNEPVKHAISKCKCPTGLVNETKSLQQVLQELANTRQREAWQSKYQLALQLTLGVLRFQSTPWLSRGLTSGDIRFFQSDDSEEHQAQSIQFPYIQIDLLNKTCKQQGSMINRASNHLARNELLFSLGVVLLELGYDAPLQYLQRPEDIRDGHGPNDVYTNFFTARRMSCVAARELDARYGRLVKKCLDCDFGVGDNLQTVALQDAIVKGVIEELELCIKSDAEINYLLMP